MRGRYENLVASSSKFPLTLPGGAKAVPSELQFALEITRAQNVRLWFVCVGVHLT